MTLCKLCCPAVRYLCSRFLKGSVDKAAIRVMADPWVEAAANKALDADFHRAHVHLAGQEE
jgi:hypothetical protein